MSRPKILPFDAAADVGQIRVRVHPLDVGFDLRAEDMAVVIPADTTRASYGDRTGARWVVEGDARAVARELARHGYRCVMQ